jgi:hypothetical protein
MLSVVMLSVVMLNVVAPKKSLFISGRLSHKFSVSSGRCSIQHNYTQYNNTQNKKPNIKLRVWVRLFITMLSVVMIASLC